MISASVNALRAPIYLSGLTQLTRYPLGGVAAADTPERLIFSVRSQFRIEQPVVPMAPSMIFYPGETGQTIRVDAGWDMSGNTDIKLVFQAPAGEIIEKGLSGGLVLSPSSVVDAELGELEANEFVELECDQELFQTDGDWFMNLKYENSNASPPRVFYGSYSRILVLPVP